MQWRKWISALSAGAIVIASVATTSLAFALGTHPSFSRVSHTSQVSLENSHALTHSLCLRNDYQPFYDADVIRTNTHWELADTNDPYKATHWVHIRRNGLVPSQTTPIPSCVALDDSFREKAQVTTSNPSSAPSWKWPLHIRSFKVDNDAWAKERQQKKQSVDVYLRAIREPKKNSVSVEGSVVSDKATQFKNNIAVDAAEVVSRFNQHSNEKYIMKAPLHINQTWDKASLIFHQPGLYTLEWSIKINLGKNKVLEGKPLREYFYVLPPRKLEPDHNEHSTTSRPSHSSLPSHISSTPPSPIASSSIPHSAVSSLTSSHQTGGSTLNKVSSSDHYASLTKVPESLGSTLEKMNNDRNVTVMKHRSLSLQNSSQQETFHTTETSPSQSYSPSTSSNDTSQTSKMPRSSEHIMAQQLPSVRSSNNYASSPVEVARRFAATASTSVLIAGALIATVALASGAFSFIRKP